MNEALDLECQLDLSTAIETLACSAFVRLELGKLGFPEAKDIGFNGADAGYVPDLEVQAIRDGGRVDNALSGKISCHFSPGRASLFSPGRFSLRSIGSAGSGVKQKKLTFAGFDPTHATGCGEISEP
jgi:hypothetical protein